MTLIEAGHISMMSASSDRFFMKIVSLLLCNRMDIGPIWEDRFRARLMSERKTYMEKECGFRLCGCGVRVNIKPIRLIYSYRTCAFPKSGYETFAHKPQQQKERKRN